MPRIVVTSLMIAGAVGIYLITSTHNPKDTEKLRSTFMTSPGKANLPLQVQIKHTDIPENPEMETTLKAFFKAPGAEGAVDFQWDLPEGVLVLTGEKSGTRDSQPGSLLESQITVTGLTRLAQQRVRVQIQAKISGQQMMRSASIVTQPESTWENYGPEIKKASDQLRQEAETKSEQ